MESVLDVECSVRVIL
jgi:hypothetical protein